MTGDPQPGFRPARRGIFQWMSTPWRDGRFWLIQTLILVIDFGHAALEDRGVLDASSSLYIPATSLILIPLVYAALVYGLRGAVPTALWVLVLSTPELVEFHNWHTREGTLSVLIIDIALTILVAFRVDKERASTTRAERAAAKLRTANERLEMYVRLASEAQEEERKRLSRELHDDTLQALVTAKGQIDSVTTEVLEPTIHQRLRGVQTILATTVDNVRRYSRDLRPSLLDDLGLIDAIDWLVEDLDARSSITARLELHGQPVRLNDHRELIIFRVVQEALRNTERHSSATHALVTLTFSPAALSIVVRDDGEGFAQVPQRQPDYRGGGLGLLGLQERAKLLAGTLTISSETGQGTTITLTVPLTQPSELATV
ncbi:MAG: sensor histidine kinase [Actinomycetes bacterium]